MRNREQNKTKLGSLMALTLFGLFAVCILTVLLTGADVYRNVTERDQMTYEKRTVAQFLTTKARQADVEGWLEAGTFEGLDALTISETIDGISYCTRIYCYDGYIRELFAEADCGMTAEAGEKVLPAEGLQVWQEHSVIHVEVTATDGTVQQLFLYPRSGKEVIR